MVQCIVIARNGCGDAWVFKDTKAARLHPIPQLDDVYATTAESLVEQYGKGLINDLLRFAGGRDRARLEEAFANWKSGGKHLAPEARTLLWDLVCGAAATPPDDPVALIRIIKEDRLFREGRVLRSIGTEERSSAKPPSSRKGTLTMAEAQARKRVNENATITVLSETNPKRTGSKAADRFALYQTGMTVKQAKEAGLQAVDITYDVAHEYISLTPPAEAATTVAAEGEEAPKKRRKKAA